MTILEDVNCMGGDNDKMSCRAVRTNRLQHSFYVVHAARFVLSAPGLVEKDSMLPAKLFFAE